MTTHEIRNPQPADLSDEKKEGLIKALDALYVAFNACDVRSMSVRTTKGDKNGNGHSMLTISPAP